MELRLKLKPLSVTSPRSSAPTGPVSRPRLAGRGALPAYGLLLACSLLLGASLGTAAAEAKPGALADSPELVDNKKILAATVAGMARDEDGAPVKTTSGRLSLPELWELAERRNPGLVAGREAVRSARFTRDEQKWLRLPSGEFTGYLSWSPKVSCRKYAPDSSVGALFGGGPGQCLETDGALNLQNDDLRNYLPIYGALVRLDLRIVQPLYTFGKLDAALKLGEVGVQLTQAAADGARADLQVNLVRAYFGLKAARAALYSVKEGQEQIVKWVAQMDKELESGKTSFTEIDLLRLKVTESVVQVQAVDAERIIASALAALRYLAQDPNVDVDEQDLQLWGREEHELGYYLDAALRYRPELRTLKATGEGARLFKKLRIAELFPDFALVASVNYGLASGIEDSSHAFVNHFNYIGAGLGLVMHMNLDFGPRAARLQKAIADMNVFEARKREALGGGALEIERQYNDLREAQKRLAASEQAERRARGWLQGIKQNIDVGTAESRDMIDALRTYFEQHVAVLRSINDVNVQAAVLRRLCGLEVIAK